VSDFHVDPDRLPKAAPKFTDAGADLAAALTALRSVLAECTAMCGDDEQGRIFAKGYDPAAKTIAESLTFASTAVKGVGSAVQVMADNYEELEDKGTRATRTNGGGR